MASGHERLARLRGRYSDLVSDRFYAMTASTNFRQAQKKWLIVIGRKRPFQSIDDWVERENRWKNEDQDSQSSLSWEVDAISTLFAVAPWHVLWAMFVRGHHPGNDLSKMFPMDMNHPRALLLVAGHDIGLAEQLHKRALGSDVYIELCLENGLQPEHKGTDVPLISVGIPIELPPELARCECSRALRQARDILRGSGLPMPYRAREETQDSTATSLVLRHTDPRLLATLIPVCLDAGLTLRSEMDGKPRGQSDTLLSGLYMEVRFPPTVQSAHLSKLVTRMIKDSRLIIKGVGLDLGDRLRPSVLVKQNPSLEVNGRKLPKRGLGDLAERLLDDFPAKSSEFTLVGRKATTTLKSRRSKVKKRFARKGLITDS
jgi:hypothetical protein